MANYGGATLRHHVAATLLEGSLGVTRQPVAKFARVEVMAMPADPAPAIPPDPQLAAAPSVPMSCPDGMIEIALPGGVGVLVDAQGYLVRLTGGTHLKITHPEMHGPVFASSTPSDWRSRANMRARLRRKRQRPTP